METIISNLKLNVKIENGCQSGTLSRASCRKEFWPCAESYPSGVKTGSRLSLACLVLLAPVENSLDIAQY